MYRRLSHGVLILLWATLGAAAHAATVEVTITSVLPPNTNFGDPGEPVPISAFYIVDTSIADTDPDSERGNYPFAVTGGFVLVGDAHYDVVPNVGNSRIIVVNDREDQGDVLFLGAEIRSDAGDGAAIEIELRSLDPQTLPSDGIPEFDLDLTDFDPYNPTSFGGSTFFAVALDGYPVVVDAPITSFEYRVVPLPGGLALLVSALGAVTVLRRTRRTSAAATPIPD